MRFETTINELADMQGLFTTVDHIKVPDTHPDTTVTEEVSLPPPVIRRTKRRDGTPIWVLTPPGFSERIHVADQAPVIVFFKEVDPGRFTGHLPPPTEPHAGHPQTAHQPPPAAWQPTAPAPTPAPAPAQPATPAPAAPPRRAAPWNQQPH